MAEEVAWTKRLQQIAKWSLLGAGGLAVGLIAIFFTLSFFWAVYVLGGLLGAKLGLWEFDLNLG